MLYSMHHVELEYGRDAFFWKGNEVLLSFQIAATVFIWCCLCTDCPFTFKPLPLPLKLGNDSSTLVSENQ